MNPLDAFNNLSSRFHSRSVTEQLHQVIYWGTLSLSALILGLCIYHVQRIPDLIRADIQYSMQNRPWVDDLIVVDGRDVYLRGEVEPGSELGLEIDIIAGIDGVRSVTNRVSEEPKPSIHMELTRNAGELTLSGKMSGDILEMIIPKLETSFVDAALKDRVKIDDRMGWPLWMDGIEQSLEVIEELAQFELHGWRDQLLITGIAPNQMVQREIGFSVPASLVSSVRVTNQLRLPVAQNFPDIQIQSNWQGTAIKGRFPSEAIRDKFIDAASEHFSVTDIDLEVTVDNQLFGENQLNKIIGVLPSLGDVRDLNLQSSGKGFVVWGRVDSAESLGAFLHARNQAGLEQVLDNQIYISRGHTPSRVALFSDGTRAVVEGVLPSIGLQQSLFKTLHEVLDVKEILDMTSVEPNVTTDPWMKSWQQILQALPNSVVGVSINQKTILITGNAADNAQLAAIDSALDSYLPGLKHLNWATAAN